MKRLFYSLAVIAATLCTACDHYDHVIADQSDRLDILEQSTIKEMDDQIEAINTSIENLEAVDAELEALIESLKTADNTNAELIAKLETQNAELDKKIAELKKYVDDELANSKEWAESTFATLEQYATIQKDIAALSDLLDQHKTDHSTDIESVNKAIQTLEATITSLEDSMKKWVNETLAEGYYDIAAIDAKLETLNEELAGTDDDLAKELEDQKAALEQAKKDLAEAYKAAIEEAIEEHNGVISKDIADAVQKAMEQVSAKLADISNDIAAIKKDIEAIQTSIASLEDQIAAINESITDLEGVDAELEKLIDALEKDTEDNAELIAALKSKDEELDKQIAELKKYVDDELANSKEWAELTFATLKEYEEMKTKIAELDALIETNKSDIKTAAEDLKKAIAASEESMKTWVNEELVKVYEEIAEVEGLLEALETKLAGADENLAKDIKAQQEALAELKTTLTTAYEQAIKEAIEEYNGKITEEIAKQVQAVENDLETKIQTITTDVDTLKKAVEELTDTITDLVSRIQSLRFVPEYSDGKVELGEATDLTFLVSPKELAASITAEHVKAYVVRSKVRTKAVDTPTELKVTAVAGNADGVLNVTVSDTGLPEDFWSYNQEGNIYISISDGNNDIISEMIPICTVINKYKIVDSQAAAQDDLDNAVEGTTIKLTPGVNYGILYMRPVQGAAMTKTVDWIGNNYGFESYSLFENITIVGAEGATVDAIEIEGGTYYYSEHSQADIHPVMLSLIELKNVKFDGITFTGKGGYDPEGHGNVINLSGNNIKVDGLTLNNCVLKNSENNARLLYKTESTTHLHKYAYNDEEFEFRPSMKDITVNGCTFNGGYMGMELRETENITITKNVFNVADRNILLPVNTGFTYSGYITITDNVSNNAKERFVRADGTGDAVVVISGNTINNYLGADKDYIKVTNGNNITIENNTINVENANQLEAAFKTGGKAVLVDDIVFSNDEEFTVGSGVTTTLDLNGKTISTISDKSGANYNLIDVRGTLNIKNGTISTKHTVDMGWGASTQPFNVTAGGVLNLENATIQNLGGSSMAFCVHLNNWGEATLNATNCTFESTYIAIRVFNSGPHMNNVTIKNSKLKGKYCFWVHNYTLAGDSTGTDETLNFDIFNGTNTFEYTSKAPVLYGFNNPIYYDAEGNVITF